MTPLYDRLLAEERRHPNGKAAVAASTALLDELIAEQAESYEDLHLVGHRPRGELSGLPARDGSDGRTAAELAVYRAFVRDGSPSTCEAAAAGDLEARSALPPETEARPDLAALHHAVNRVLDVSDAFVRESSAALTSAAEGRFHRKLLLTGLRGAFRAERHRHQHRPGRHGAVGRPGGRGADAPACGWPTSSSPSCSPCPSRWRRRRRR